MSDNGIPIGLGVSVAADDIGVAGTVTITNASPGVVTDTGHVFGAGQPIILTTTGGLPTGLTAGQIYYVLNPATNTYQLAATPGGTAINTSSAGSGTHTRTSIVLVQRFKVGFGSDGAYQDADGTHGLPVTVLNSNTNVQGGAPVTVGAVVPTATANGATASRVNAAANTNATNLKASAGQVYAIDVFNNAAYAVFLKLYNKASSPTVGTDTPVWTIPIQAGGGFSREFPRGKSFATGIAYAITKLQADSDTTVVVAGDLTGSIDWI